MIRDFVDDQWILDARDDLDCSATTIADRDKVCISAAEKNLKSRAVSERLGLVNEGVEREAEYLYGQYVNHVRYSLGNRFGSEAESRK